MFPVTIQFLELEGVVVVAHNRLAPSSSTLQLTEVGAGPDVPAHKEDDPTTK